MLGPVVLLMLVAASWSADVCCPDIGCFTDDSPFDRLPLPWCMNEWQSDPIYTLFTRSNRVSGEEVGIDGIGSIPNVFQPNLRTLFVVHGYTDDAGSNWLDEIKDDALTREDMNVITVDWSGAGAILNYNQAASNTRSAGAYTALIADNLVQNGGSDYSLIWCTGHSLGSHVCGHTGNHASGTLGRITGMDPAGPSFENSDDVTIGLHPGCAAYVDVFHTDISFYGTLRPLGHIDFYPAEGVDQPGCDGNLCDHIRAVEYFENSAAEDCFIARQECNNHANIPGSCSACTCGTDGCAIMGFGADTSCQLTGIYYLDIDPIEPFCQG
jgi:hypothetical protein